MAAVNVAPKRRLSRVGLVRNIKPGWTLLIVTSFHAFIRIQTFNQFLASYPLPLLTQHQISMPLPKTMNSGARTPALGSVGFLACEFGWRPTEPPISFHTQAL